MMGPKCGVDDVLSLTAQLDLPLSLDPTAWRLAAGDVLFLVGPNGAGKSTLLRALHDNVGDLVAAPSGCVLLSANDLDASSQVADQLARFDALPDGGLRSRDLEIYGISTGLRVGELSSGECDRLRIFAAAHTRARAILIDAPTSHVDSEGRERMIEVINARTAAGASFIIATHDVELVLALPDAGVRRVVDRRIEVVRPSTEGPSEH